jgi:DegV family protein with EDD domain
MPTICIVTDSSAHFASNHFLTQNPLVTVVPNHLHLAGRVYREGQDITLEDAFKLMHPQSEPMLHPAPESDYVELFTRLIRQCDAIISIHASRDLTTSYQNALQASRQFSFPIAVINSQQICIGQGLLVKVALKAVQEGHTFEDIVRIVRGAIERVYALYYVETVQQLQHSRLMAPSHAVLSVMLGVKPFLSLENGQLNLVEKVKTRAQAVDRLVEFVTEFDSLEEAVILQHKTYTSEQTRSLQDRLATDFPGQHFAYTMYSASLAALIGTDATGIVVLEKEMEDFQDEL